MAPSRRHLAAPTGIAALAVGLALVACMPAVPAHADDEPAAATSPGKSDGDSAKLGADLVDLHRSFVAFTATSDAEDGAFVPSDPTLRVADGRVAVDATASDDPALLEHDLVTLGLVASARVGPVVSGFLPIRALPDAAALPTLRQLSAAKAATR